MIEIHCNDCCKLIKREHYVRYFKLRFCNLTCANHYFGIDIFN